MLKKQYFPIFPQSRKVQLILEFSKKGIRGRELFDQGRI
jgi:hypothetical protein